MVECNLETASITGRIQPSGFANMKQLTIGQSSLKGSAISLGCMRMAGMKPDDIDALISTSMEVGINFYDHADIYGGGKSEEVFASSVKRLGIQRDQLILQSKCGIRSGFFDFSKEHILSSVDGILERLDTDYIDILLLHRPDTLVEPEEVAEAFTHLHDTGKVRNFGVSNHNPSQILLLQSCLPFKLHVNQLQFSITNTGMLNHGLTVNMEIDNSIDRDGSVLDFCRLNKITVQPWSPFQYGFFKGAYIGNPEFPELNACLEAMAEKYGVSVSAIAIAWILRHPAHMQPIVGTTRADRIAEIAKASEVEMSRPDWYELYRSAGNILP
jgi:predicted oxidoreductase